MRAILVERFHRTAAALDSLIASERFDGGRLLADLAEKYRDPGLVDRTEAEIVAIVDDLGIEPPFRAAVLGRRSLPAGWELSEVLELGPAVRRPGGPERRPAGPSSSEGFSLRSLTPEAAAERNRALVRAAYRSVLDSERSAQTAAIDTGPVNRSIAYGLAGTTDPGRAAGRVLTEGRGRRREAVIGKVQGRIEVFHPDERGRPRLLFPAVSVTEALTEECRTMAARGHEILRHYLGLLVMLEENGRKHQATWYLDEHHRRIGVSRERGRRPDVRRNTLRVLDTLAGFHVAYTTEVNGERREHVGRLFTPNDWSRPEGDPTGMVDGVELTIHRILYDGVRPVDAAPGQFGNQWTSFPVELAQLDHNNHGWAIAVGVSLLHDWRTDRRKADDEGRTRGERRIRGRVLLERGGWAYNARRQAEDCRRMLAQLEELKRIGLIGGWRWEPGGLDAMIDVWWGDVLSDRDRGVHPPLALPDATPTTGAELVAWMDGRGLTRDGLADLLAPLMARGGGASSVKRWRALNGKALPAKVVDALRKIV